MWTNFNEQQYLFKKIGGAAYRALLRVGNAQALALFSAGYSDVYGICIFSVIWKSHDHRQDHRQNQ